MSEIEMYLKLGLAIFPCHYPVINGTNCCSCGKPECDRPAKHPYGRFAPAGFKSASKDPHVIRRWDGGNYNIAAATGAVSGIVVVDIDPRHDGGWSLVALEQEHGALPHTWHALTGGGGEHFYFRHPGRFVGCSEAKIAPGIDVRGDDGYAILPPSRHISGRPYAWDVDHHPEHVALADMPEWLLAKASTEKPKVDWRRFADEPVPEGQRHKAIRSLAGLLFYRLYREPDLAARLLVTFNQGRCQPPLPDEEIERIIDHAAGREAARRRRAGA
jgi:putative DNA primase/helicase